MRKTRPIHVMSVALLVSTSAFAQGQSPLEAKDRPPPVRAGEWINAQPFDFYEPTQAVLLEFWSVRSPACRTLVKPLNRLRAKYGLRLSIIGVTENKAREVQWYIKRQGPRYKIAAESDAARTYKVDMFPTVVLIDTRERRIVWRESGDDATPKSIRKAVKALLGDPDGADRSARKFAEEQADRSLLGERMQRAGEHVDEIVVDILARLGEGELSEPQDLYSLEDFYDQNLPPDLRDPKQSRSEGWARSLVAGYDSGYGSLIQSDRLSADAKAYAFDQLFSIAEFDWAPTRGEAVQTLRRLIGENAAPEMLDRLRHLLARETHPNTKGILRLAIDQGNPETATAAKAILKTRVAGRLFREFHNEKDPSAGRWADAHAYTQTISDRDTTRLLGDYQAFRGGDDDLSRENAIIKRDAALSEIGNRIVREEIADTHAVQSSMIEALSSEEDPGLRGDIGELLWTLGGRIGEEDRGRIIEALEAQLAVEPERYYTGPNLEFYINELRAMH